MINKLKKRIIDISYKHNLSHLGSCLSTVEIIDYIYSIKKIEEKFILSSGHVGLALYVVLEKYGFGNAEDILNHHGVHPDRCDKCHLDCSSGSLGHGLPISIGMALTNSQKKVYCLISDGECAEGSIWESLNILEELQLKNLFVHVNCNGWAAYKKVDCDKLKKCLESHTPTMKNNIIIHNTTVEQFPFLKGNDAHYYIMSENDYNSINMKDYK